MTSFTHRILEISIWDLPFVRIPTSLSLFGSQASVFVNPLPEEQSKSMGQLGHWFCLPAELWDTWSPHNFWGALSFPNHLFSGNFLGVMIDCPQSSCEGLRRNLQVIHRLGANSHVSGPSNYLTILPVPLQILTFVPHSFWFTQPCSSLPFQVAQELGCWSFPTCISLDLPSALHEAASRSRWPTKTLYAAIWARIKTVDRLWFEESQQKLTYPKFKLMLHLHQGVCMLPCADAKCYESILIEHKKRRTLPRKRGDHLWFRDHLSSSGNSPRCELWFRIFYISLSWVKPPKPIIQNMKWWWPTPAPAWRRFTFNFITTSPPHTTTAAPVKNVEP